MERPEKFYSDLRYINEPENLEIGSLSFKFLLSTCARVFYLLKNPSTVFEPANLGLEKSSRTSCGHLCKVELMFLSRFNIGCNENYPDNAKSYSMCRIPTIHLLSHDCTSAHDVSWRNNNNIQSLVSDV